MAGIQNNLDMQRLKSRLDEIVEAVSDDDLSMDDALSLYEEAVKLGSRASEIVEQNIQATRE